MIVTIDGPAGAGKSSVSRMLAQRLGFAFLDTGAMYRAVALAALRQNLGWNDPTALAALARRLNIEIRDDRTYLEGEDVSSEIRSHEVTSATHYAANNVAVRAHLVQLQRQVAGRLDIVTEGRDQGTVVFPHAECKIFLDASPHERARRRQADLAARGEKLSLDEVLADQNRRDESDAAREVGPLVAAADAVHVNTDGLAPEEVVDRLEALVRARMPEAAK
ncbi:MAG TPA: (d)CMP kinase [Pirellulales bacterium]|nr:(d)CMP kinase [Pirellulales bacterium]